MTIGIPTTPTNTETFSAVGTTNSLVFVTLKPDNTINKGNNASGLTYSKKFVLYYALTKLFGLIGKNGGFYLAHLILFFSLLFVLIPNKRSRVSDIDSGYLTLLAR